MNGTVIPNTPIAVDFWQLSKCPAHCRPAVFFLTHMHEDHTRGLSPSWNLPIYCSPLTKKLLIHKFSIGEQYIHSLEINESHIVNLTTNGEVTCTVTVIDANHCPGSVMFLFEGYFGIILHTGDFRYDKSMFVTGPLSTVTDIDTVFLDNTYCSPQCEFFSREDAVTEICKIIHRHQDKRVIIGIRSLGKEDLLVKLAKKFQTRITVSQKFHETLSILQAPNVFTLEESSIKTVPLMKITRKTMERWNQEEPTIAILPTSLYVGRQEKPFSRDSSVHIVPYSDHSSYSELLGFVRKLKPKQIIPVVAENSRGAFGADLNQRAQMDCFSKLLDPKPIPEFTIPDAVLLSNSTGFRKSLNRSMVKRRSTQISGMKSTKSFSKGVIYQDSPKVKTSDNSTLAAVNDDGKPTATSHQNQGDHKVLKHKLVADEFYAKSKYFENSTSGCMYVRRKLNITGAKKRKMYSARSEPGELVTAESRKNHSPAGVDSVTEPKLRQTETSANLSVAVKKLKQRGDGNVISEMPSTTRDSLPKSRNEPVSNGNYSGAQIKNPALLKKLLRVPVNGMTDERMKKIEFYRSAARILKARTPQGITVIRL